MERGVRQTPSRWTDGERWQLTKNKRSAAVLCEILVSFPRWESREKSGAELADLLGRAAGGFGR
jgi:hypothetical protein